MLHVPILRAGTPYRSLRAIDIDRVGVGGTVARVSQANPGLIARDLAALPAHRRALERLPVRELLAICRRAAELFAGARLPVDPVDGVRHGPDEYVETLSATTGMPAALARMNMEKIRYVLAEMETVLGGLTRGLDPAVLDAGFAASGGRSVSYIAETDALGVILPSNSPGVHSLWLPAIPLKTPLVLKPGTREPWTPLRVIQALVAAGCPAEPLGYYPTDHAGATEILSRAGRSMFFGDAATVRGWQGESRIQIHGPGWSKVLLGADRAPDWRQHLDVIVASIADNGGRSCLNASGVFTPSHGREIAETVAARLVEIEALPLDDPAARLAAFPEPGVARRISEFIDCKLEVPGAEDVTARLRGTDRLVEVGGCTFLLPTLVRCDDPEHPLTACEFLFPFAAVVETPQGEMLGRIGSTLVATALTDDAAFRRELLACRSIDRLNLGPIPTSRVAWDQPHEGNLFEHLYRQRALQAAHA
jgi:acyl-CoA reductase-like NAD-dependent aldehyde dehydrogenase